MTFTNKLHYTNSLGVIPENEEMTQFEKVDNKKIIEINAKLEVLELVGGIVDSLREGLTRQLVVNDIKDEKTLENKLNKMDVVEHEELSTVQRKEIEEYVNDQFKGE
jgi:BMFP domain-containing protein YqiC